MIPLAGAQRLILREEPWTKATRRTRSRHCLLLLEGPSGRAPVWRFADRPTADRFVARLAPRLRLEVSEERGSLTDTACQSQGSEPGG